MEACGAMQESFVPGVSIVDDAAGMDEEEEDDAEEAEDIDEVPSTENVGKLTDRTAATDSETRVALKDRCGSIQPALWQRAHLVHRE